MYVSTSDVKVTKGKGVLEQMAELFGPGKADQLLRQAMEFCWMALPEGRRNAEELERQMRRLVDRALKDFREDIKAFARSPKAKKGRQSN